MQKNDPDPVVKCEEHSFTLTPLYPSCHFPKTMTALYCEVPTTKSKHTALKKNSKHCDSSNIPVYNRDRNYASSGFILQSEKNYYKQSFQRLIIEHQHNVLEHENSKSVLCVPKPRSKSKYCSVCKNYYEEYIQLTQHIGTNEHQKKIKNSKFNKYIVELQKQFTQKNTYFRGQKYQQYQQQMRSNKVQSIATKTPISISQGSQKEQYQPNLRKMIKYDLPQGDLQPLFYPFLPNNRFQNNYQRPMTSFFNQPPVYSCFNVFSQIPPFNLPYAFQNIPIHNIPQQNIPIRNIILQSLPKVEYIVLSDDE